MLSIITWWQPSISDRAMVDAIFRSGCHRNMEISYQRTGLIETWLAMLVSYCEYQNFISLLYTDLPTLKRLINTLPLKGLAQTQ